MRFEWTCDAEDPEEVKAELAYHLNGIAQRNRNILDRERFPRLYRSGVRYGVDEDIAFVQRLLNCRQVLAQRFACCKSLCAWRVAELRNDARSEHEAALIDFAIDSEEFDRDPLRVGLQPRNGLVRVYHVNVVKADGSVENPSRKLRR
jgi:hypothetical protein